MFQLLNLLLELRLPLPHLPQWSQNSRVGALWPPPSPCPAWQDRLTHPQLCHGLPSGLVAFPRHTVILTPGQRLLLRLTLARGCQAGQALALPLRLPQRPAQPSRLFLRTAACKKWGVILWETVQASCGKEQKEAPVCRWHLLLLVGW